jgi:septum formation protein
MAPTYNCILPHALNLSSSRKLAGKRVVLASASPRRAELLRNIVRHSGASDVAFD